MRLQSGIAAEADEDTRTGSATMCDASATKSDWSRRSGETSKGQSAKSLGRESAFALDALQASVLCSPDSRNCVSAQHLTGENATISDLVLARSFGGFWPWVRCDCNRATMAQLLMTSKTRARRADLSRGLNRRVLKDGGAKPSATHYGRERTMVSPARLNTGWVKKRRAAQEVGPSQNAAGAVERKLF